MTRKLRERVLEGLPTNVHALLDEIESFAGVPVDFERYQFPSRANAFNPKAPATAVSPTEATVYLHDFDELDLHGLTHELLHIRRYWVEGVPQIQPARNIEENLRATQNIENGLEHLVIVPRERTYGFEAESERYWNAVSRHRWEQYPWPDASARRNDILLERLALRLVSDSDVHQLAADYIRAEGLTDEADRFAARVLELLSNKVRVASCVVRFMKIPKGLLHLAYIDIRNRSHRVEAIPDH